jgi:hypothetical protein
LRADWWVASKAEMLAEKMVELMVEMSVALKVETMAYWWVVMKVA